MSDLEESCKEFVRSFARCLIYLRAVRVCQEICEVSNRVGNCKEFVRRIAK